MQWNYISNLGNKKSEKLEHEIMKKESEVPYLPTLTKHQH